MPTRTRDPQRERFWRTIFADRPASPLTLAAFCKQRGVTISAYYFWKRELQQRDAQSQPERATFVPVTVGAEPTPAIEVRCPSGHIVTIANVNGRTLQELFAALAETQSC